MYIPDDLVEEIRSRNDIVDIVSSRIKLQKKGSSYFGLCPFHNEKSPSFSVSPNKQMFYCFGCGEGGNVFSFLMKYDNLTFSEALKELADRAGIELPDVRMSAEERNRSDLKIQCMISIKKLQDIIIIFWKQRQAIMQEHILTRENFQMIQLNLLDLVFQG